MWQATIYGRNGAPVDRAYAATRADARSWARHYSGPGEGYAVSRVVATAGSAS